MQERGWALDRQQKPPSLHCSVTANHAPVLDTFVEDLREAVALCKDDPSRASEGEAAMYGMMAKIPFRGMVKMSVQKVMEELYGKNAAEPDLGNIGGGEDAGPLLQLVDRYGERILGELDRLDGLRDAARDLGRKLRPGG